MVRNKASLNCQVPSTVQGNNKEDAHQHVTCATLYTPLVQQKGPALQGAQAQGTQGGIGRGTALSLVLLSIAVVGLVVTILFLKRVHYKPRCSSLLDTVSRKVQYTTIGNHEEEVDV